MKRSHVIVAVLSSLGIAACNGTGAFQTENRKDAGPPANCDPTKYPCGPYGLVVGQVLDNLELLGQRDDNKNGTPTDDPVRKIHLADYFQDKSIKVLAILVAAEWCGPCQMEQPELITAYKNYQAQNKGVAMLEAIIEDKSHKPADMTTVDRWANYKWGMNQLTIPFDMAADPTVALGPYYNVAAFPMQMVVLTKDMTIQWQNNGYRAGDVETAVGAAFSN